MMACASMPSILRSQCTWLPSPTGRPYASTSTTPPRLSPSLAAASISAIIFSSAALSKQRTDDSSMRARSRGVGRATASLDTEPSAVTCDTISTPIWRSNNLASAPATTRALVSRALARSSTSRASTKSYFCMPAKSAWPGRGCVSGFFVAPGCGDISSCHTSLRNHSVFFTSTATGEPSVRPWRMPPINSISSCSNFCRGPLPNPRRRRANSADKSAAVTGRFDGRPSTITTRA